MSPIYIGLGCQRSGTSIIAEILTAPRSSAFHVENGIVRYSLIWFEHALRYPDHFSSLRFNEFVNVFMVRGERYAKRVLPATTEIIVAFQQSGQMERWLRTGDVRGFLRALWEAVLKHQRRNASFHGDKYPEHLLFVPQIVDVDPSARFIFIYRQPEAAIEAMSRKLSVLSSPISDFRFSVDDRANQWIAWHRFWMQERERIPRQHIIELSFDRFIADPGRYLTRQSEFTGVDLVGDTAVKLIVEKLDAERNDRWRLTKHGGRIAALMTERPEIGEMHAALLQSG